MSLFRFLANKIERTFTEYPCQFFTEHDIHSQLAFFANRLLEERGELYFKTRDGVVVSRVHHEYPTPFRCHMKGTEFKLISEEEFAESKRKGSGFRARRGYIDFVILNSEYIASNELRVVSGKRYRDFLESLKDRRHEVLDLAVEVVYFPVLDERLHEGIMERKVKSSIQDYQKLVALMRYRGATGVPFCREAGMLLLSNTPYETKMRERLEQFPTDKNVEFLVIIR